MTQILLVAAGGAFGSVCRYLAGLLAVRAFGPSFPFGTLAVNIVGCLAIGLLAELIARRFDGSAELRLLLITGVLGGFTTFSSFSLDFVTLLERGDGVLAFVYVGASLLLSLAAVMGGLAAGRMLL